MQGLRKLFVNLSIASKKVSERKEQREKLQGYLKKIKIVSAQSVKKSVISSEIEKLERHISQMLDKKLKHSKNSKAEIEHIKELKRKEKELNEKIKKLNVLLAKVGKKVDEEQVKEQLSEPEKPSLIEVLEEKLYLLESKYEEVKQNRTYPEEALLKIEEKISDLKEKIRELKVKQ